MGLCLPTRDEPMVDQPLHEHLEPLIGWDDMNPEARFEVCRKASLQVLLDQSVGRWTYEELVDQADQEREDLEDTLGYYITDPADPTCGYYNISDLDQFSGYEMMSLLCDLFPELESNDDADFGPWLQAFVRRARLGQIAGRGSNTADPGQL